MWTKKYAPKNLDEIYGQEEASRRLRAFVNNYKGGAAMIYGPVGSGKTCAVYALAKELGYDILEINSSDTRNKGAINSLVNSSIKQASLFNRGKLILIDEIDALSGTGDRGGAQALAKLIDESKFPIVITANDISEKKISTLAKKCTKIEFQPLNYSSIMRALEKICKEEGIDHEDGCLQELARQAGSDMRAAINDLQALSNGRKKLKKDDLKCLGYREFEENMLNALRLVFKSRKTENILGAFDKVDCDLNEAMLWIDENITKEYSNDALAKAYEAISRADVFNGRIRRRQHWRFLVYINSLLTAGIALAKKEKKQGYVEYKRSSRPLKIWIANMKNIKKMSIAEKAADKLHISTKHSFKEFLPYLQFIIKGKDCERISTELGLSEDELEKL